MREGSVYMESYFFFFFAAADALYFNKSDYVISDLCSRRTMLCV